MSRAAAESLAGSGAGLPEPLRSESLAGLSNGVVGSVLVSETDRVRVWHLRIAPGARCAFHRHQLDYFWTAMTGGQARNINMDGSVSDVTYVPGDTKHFTFGPGEYFVHSVENVGPTELVFTTVEFKGGPNPPLDVPASVRLHPAT
jgi:hypothetical protein